VSLNNKLGVKMKVRIWLCKKENRSDCEETMEELMVNNESKHYKVC
jgi:hypothetical protein